MYCSNLSERAVNCSARSTTVSVTPLNDNDAIKNRWVEGLGLELLAHAISAFDVDVVLVMKHDRLYSDMVATLPRSVAIINLPRSGGACRTWRHRAWTF